MKKIICIIIITATLLQSCAQRFESNSYFALDTFITVNLPQGCDVDVYGIIKEYESILSKTDTDSEIYKMNGCAEYETTDDVISLLKYAVEISEKTDGAFDITCGNITLLWDFKTDKPAIPNEEDIEKALFSTGYKNITFEGNTVKKNNGVTLDLGGIAKGYIAEKCVKELHKNGITSGFLNLGGNIAIVGEKENGKGFSVALKDPFNTSSTVGKITLDSGYFSVSGDYERFFEYNGEKYHHIIDPQTGYSAKSDVVSVAVISENGALADALSTALFVMGLDEAIDFYEKNVYDFDAVLITKTKEVYLTDGIKDGFILTNGDYTVSEG